MVATIVGFGLRALTPLSFGFYIAGTVVVGLGGPFLANSRIVILSDWLEGRIVRDKFKNFLMFSDLNLHQLFF